MNEYQPRGGWLKYNAERRAKARRRAKLFNVAGDVCTVAIAICFVVMIYKIISGA